MECEWIGVMVMIATITRWPAPSPAAASAAETGPSAVGPAAGERVGPQHSTSMRSSLSPPRHNTRRPPEVEVGQVADPPAACYTRYSALARSVLRRVPTRAAP